MASECFALHLAYGEISSAKFALKQAIQKLNDDPSVGIYQEILTYLERQNQKHITVKLLGGQIDAMRFALEYAITLMDEHMALVYHDILNKLPVE